MSEKQRIGDFSQKMKSMIYKKRTNQLVYNDKTFSKLLFGEILYNVIIKRQTC